MMMFTAVDLAILGIILVAVFSVIVGGTLAVLGWVIGLPELWKLGLAPFLVGAAILVGFRLWEDRGHDK